MVISSNLGFPRIGGRRELKKALENFWFGDISEAELLAAAKAIRCQHWQLQQAAQIEHIPSNDFSLYDHVLDTAVMVGAVPDRFAISGRPSLTDYFAMARGRSGVPGRRDAAALEMTKWFDTNYHYLVPEFSDAMPFKLLDDKPVREFLEAMEIGIETRPVILGPFSLLMLGKTPGRSSSLHRLPELVQIYTQLLEQLHRAGAVWVQMDEPCLSLDMDGGSNRAFCDAYTMIGSRKGDLKILMTSYFSDMGENLDMLLDLPIDGVHLDLVYGPQMLDRIIARRPSTIAVSLGLVNGRNIWKANIDGAIQMTERAVSAFGVDRVLVAPSCSLLHVPMDVSAETALGSEIKASMSFAVQKLDEIALIKKGALAGRKAIADAIEASAAAARVRAAKFYDASVRQRVAALTPEMCSRPESYPRRAALQQDRLHLPPLPTTTIGSFPQTAEVRKARADYVAGRMDEESYKNLIQAQIRQAVKLQEQIGLDVLVHGEFERTDMVEFFGAHLTGFATTQWGWVQSYGSRCVKPPIIFGDVQRREPITVELTEFAQSLTKKPVKGMLTGPLTILNWSFVRDDLPRSETCRQIALAIRDEVVDLDAAGIAIIQIDEPTLREGLPLRKAERPAYLRWAVDAFRISAAGASAHTQIHTHMCYCDFDDIIDAIIEMDADVISLETARSSMELLGALARRHYPNQIGPGVYDIHSPRVPPVAEMQQFIGKILQVLKPEQVWINPDCGLKTRRWEEVIPALANMVAAAQNARSAFTGMGA